MEYRLCMTNFLPTYCPNCGGLVPVVTRLQYQAGSSVQCRKCLALLGRAIVTVQGKGSTRTLHLERAWHLDVAPGIVMGGKGETEN
jgi:hypothetical protein